jgi:creatinine amidohydrolase
MTAQRWQDLDRVALAAILPEALVVVPVGATEQHGPHLPTGTDALIVEAVTAEAARLAAPHAARQVVLTPVVSIGASDHHFPFGATLSLTTETMTALLVDLLRSVGESGATRVILVNGHGGNRGPCHSACHLAGTRYRLHAGYLDYWTLAGADPADPPIPGHAGAFETSLIGHLRPDLLGKPPRRPSPPDVAEVPDVSIHTPSIWEDLQGFTDSPADAATAAGLRWFQECTAALSDRMVALATSL